MVLLTILLFLQLHTHCYSFNYIPFFRYSTTMTQKLTCSEIDALVAERDQHRAVMNYAKSDEIKTYLASIGVEIFDVSYKCEGNSKWTYTNEVVSSVETNLMTLAHEAYHALSTGCATESDIVAKAMELLKLQSYGLESKEEAVSNVSVSVGGSRTVVYKSSEMNGRKYVDAAFEFCMAGVSDPVLFTMLADFAKNELIRFGSKSSCKPLPILQMIEKLAVAGVRDHDIFAVAKDLLQKKGNQKDMHGMEDSMHGGYNLFSRRPLLWLWRYATKQKKPTKTSAPKDVEVEQSANADMECTQDVTIQPMPAFTELFTDPSLPLVLDLGCGYGVPLLNLCDQQHRGVFARRCNYLGVDLSDRAIRYASGMSKRWGFAGTCAFVYADCEAALAHIRTTYPGPVVLAMVNFPTPYDVSLVLGDAAEVPIETVAGAEKRKFSDAADSNEPTSPAQDTSDEPDEHVKLGGNTQLPDSFDNFMVNQALVRCMVDVLSQRSLAGVAPVLFLQSNVEDVVVTMRNIVHSVLSAEAAPTSTKTLISDEVCEVQAAIDQIFRPVAPGLEGSAGLRWRTLAELQQATSGAPGTGRMSRRLQLWSKALEDAPKEEAVASGPSHDNVHSVAARHRAAGLGWLASTPLPGNARTETEVHCDIEKQPVHRTIFVLK